MSVRVYEFSITCNGNVISLCVGTIATCNLYWRLVYYQKSNGSYHPAKKN